MMAVPAAPVAGHDDADLLQLLVHHPEGVVQGGEDDDGGAVLVVVEDRDVELLAEPGLHLEAAGGGDVFEVYAGKAGCNGPGDGDDLLDVLGVQAKRPGVDAGEAFEEGGLAFHHRQCRLTADVAQAEHG
jgi:hypothetical protein